MPCKECEAEKINTEQLYCKIYPEMFRTLLEDADYQSPYVSKIWCQEWWKSRQDSLQCLFKKWQQNRIFSMADSLPS